MISCTIGIQSIEQVKKEYGAEQAEIILGICANIISGQVSGDSGRKFSETFGKIMQDRQSMSINSSDTSISKSTQMESAIPASKIATLSSGEFVGIVADSPDVKIRQKMFHAEIQNDHAAIKKEEEGYRPLPFIQEVTAEDVRENYLKIKREIEALLKAELQKIKDRDGAAKEAKKKKSKNKMRGSLPPEKSIRQEDAKVFSR